jgi:hypothetical protein
MNSREGTKSRDAPAVRPRERGHPARRWSLLGAMLALWVAAPLLAACGGGSQPQIMDGSGEEWRVQGNHCVRENDDGGPVRRVVNRVDPELCGRTVKVRSRDYVRVVPPPGMRSR